MRDQMQGHAESRDEDVCSCEAGLTAARGDQPRPPGSVARTSHRQFHAPVLRPALRRVVRGHGVFLAETLRGHHAGVDAPRDMNCITLSARFWDSTRLLVADFQSGEAGEAPSAALQAQNQT